MLDGQYFFFEKQISDLAIANLITRYSKKSIAELVVKHREELSEIKSKLSDKFKISVQELKRKKELDGAEIFMSNEGDYIRIGSFIYLIEYDSEREKR